MKRRAGAQVQRADAFGAAHLVSREGRGVHVELLQVHASFPQRLHGIGVEQRGMIVRDTGEIGDGLDAADFAVGGLHRHEHRIGVERRLQRALLDEALTVRGEPRDAETLRFQTLRGRQHSVVLDRGDHDVRDEIPCSAPTALVRGGLRDAQQGRVVGLGGAAGEHDLVGTTRAEVARDGSARFLERGERGTAGPVERIRVAADREVRAAGHLIRGHGLGGLLA